MGEKESVEFSLPPVHIGVRPTAHLFILALVTSPCRHVEAYNSTAHFPCAFAAVAATPAPPAQQLPTRFFLQPEFILLIYCSFHYNHHHHHGTCTGQSFS